ncbi:MAG: alanine--glyoxylate aminotransferase family protein [Clostridia bacterium]|nr:alanine--glyoxylate aminotransferase family protein [Clostridia bacterium]
MINFTVGPVQSSDEVRKIGQEQVPYFRTPEFSNIMYENEKLVKKFSGASENSRVVFITGSGTASMEAAVMNIFNENDNVLIINGGSFGQRFVDLCSLYNVKYTEIKLPIGKGINEETLKKYEGEGYTGFLVNVHETSTGEHYNIEIISDFCKRNNIFLLVDAISSFLADEFNMKELHVGAMITGSQKALACPPGISLIVLSEDAIKRVENNQTKCMYLDIKNALKNGERGQTPFTPAVGILRQINARLKQIERDGGQQIEINRTRELAEYFRNAIKDLPLEIVPEDSSNAVTALHPLNNQAYKIFETLKDEYGIWICPNGGELKDKVFRVGHIGDLTIQDYDKLIDALKKLHDKGIL